MFLIFKAMSKKIEQLLAEWKVYCNLNLILHEESRGYFKVLNYGLMIPSVILGSTMGFGTIGVASSGSNDVTCSGSGIDWLLIGLGVIGIISTCLASVHRLMNVAQLQTEHDLFSDMFASLANEIDMQLALDDTLESRMFKSKHEFAKYCKSRLDVLMDKAPPIPKQIKNRKRECNIVVSIS